MILFSKNRQLLAAIGLGLFGLAGLAAPQTNISNSPNWFSSCPRVAVDSVGNVHVAWAEFYTWTNSPQVPTSGDAFYSKLDVQHRPLERSRQPQQYRPG